MGSDNVIEVQAIQKEFGTKKVVRAVSFYAQMRVVLPLMVLIL